MDDMIYYAEWDKIEYKGHIYTIVIVPTRRTIFLLYDSYKIEFDMRYAGVRYEVKLFRNRELHNDITTECITDVIKHEGLYLPDSDIRVCSFPLKVIENYLR